MQCTGVGLAGVFAMDNQPSRPGDCQRSAAVAHMTWVREQVPDVPTLLAELRRRPGMWIGTKSIERLDQMLGGIDFAEDWHRIPAKARFGGFDFTAFEVWVEHTYNPKRLSVRSFGLAATLAGSDTEGFDLWFRWYDEFIQVTGGRGAAG